MEKRPKSWFVLVLLGLSVLAFVGISLVPIVSSLLNGPQNTPPGASPVVNSAEQTRLEEEERGYQLVLQREPTNKTALEGLYETRAKLIQIGVRKPKDLIEPLSKLKDLNPEVTDLAVLLAQTQQQAGDRESSAQTYRQILATQPGNINALQGLTALFIAENKGAAAVDLLKKTIETAPQENQRAPNSVDVPGVKLILGEVYLSLKQYDASLAIYDSLIQANQSDFRPLIGKALVLKSQGKVDEAKTLFASASKLAPPQYKDRIEQLSKAEAPTPTPPSQGSSSPDSTE